MKDSLSPNTTAILLLTSPLIAGRGEAKAELLSPADYRGLARYLRERGNQPADLLTEETGELLAELDHIIDRTRLERLLARGLRLSQAVEHWRARAIWVVSRADAAYPQRLKVRLKEESPPLLYGCGEREIIETGGLAVVGSRNISEALIEYTQEIGRVAASVGRTIISGGARGVDQASMRGALEAGGRAIGVLADGLERAAMNRENRNLLLEGQLVLISPYDPGARFNVGHAMQRNKVVYALADAALVVSAEVKKGGTWAGATEQLSRFRLAPVYVRSTGEPSEALDALRNLGALPWPNPQNDNEFNNLIDAIPPEDYRQPAQRPLFSEAPLAPVDEQEEQGLAPLPPIQTIAECPAEPLLPNAADELFQTVSRLVRQLVGEPKKAAELATALGVTQRQAEEWLARLVLQGVLEKDRKRARYFIPPHGLFDGEGPDAIRPKSGRKAS